MAFVNQVKRASLESVTLTLDRNEIKLLCTVLNRIGGAPDHSPRKYATQIIEALSKEGIFLEEYDFKAAIDHTHGSNSIYFKDKSL